MIDCDKRKKIFVNWKRFGQKFAIKEAMTSSVLLLPQNPLQAINTESMTIH